MKLIGIFTSSVAQRIIVTTILCVSTMSAALSNKKKETYKDIITKAQNLSLQKDRGQATLILVSALKSEDVSQKEKAELKRTLSEVSHLFYLDKSQQLYELSISLRRTDLSQALQKSSEALRQEPDNLSILTEYARQLVVKGDCKQAAEVLHKAKQKNEYDDQLNLAYAQTQVCLGDNEKPAVALSGNEIRKLPPGWLYVDLEKNFKEKNFTKIKEILQTLAQKQPQSPEFHYWQWKTNGDSSAAQKYVLKCKEMSSYLFRQHLYDPMLCQRVTEVESFLKSVN